MNEVGWNQEISEPKKLIQTFGNYKIICYKYLKFKNLLFHSIKHTADEQKRNEIWLLEIFLEIVVIIIISKVMKSF